MKSDKIDEIAKAVLYEGYLLYPYRRAALKNRHRWSFGVLFPEEYSVASGGVEPYAMQTECLAAAADESPLQASVRFLHLYAEPDTDADSHNSTEADAVERQVIVPELSLAALSRRSISFSFGFDRSANVATGDREQEPLMGAIEIAAARLDERAFKVSLRVRNVTPFARAAMAHRNQALLRSMVSTHILMRLSGGQFFSQMDPPDEYRQMTEGCRNVGLWPVLVGEEGDRDCMLAAPIILYDYPEIAPESAGDLCDGTEIDELLTLRVLTLTDQEKNAMRRGDARAREILERTEALSFEQLMKLHGALRNVRGLRGEEKQ